MLTEYGLRPQVNGLAVALGWNRHTLYDVITGERGKLVTSASRELIKRAYELIAVFNENALLESTGNPAALIFLAKNHHEYKDVNEQRYTVARVDVQALPPSEIAERYKLQAGAHEDMHEPEQ